MNTPNSTLDQKCTKQNNLRRAVLAPALIAIAVLSSPPASAEWTVDFSRRAKAVRDTELSAAGRGADTARGPASARAAEGAAVTPELSEDAQGEAGKTVFDSIFDVGEAVTDLVILNTDKGFVPNTIRVRKNGKYKVTVVNVNEREKNVSFILDGFSEHHATYYGKTKTFFLEPKREGVFSFQSPETAAEGKLVVFAPQITIRNPAATVGSTTAVPAIEEAK